ncbi:hypothetical protein [Amycolatopsis sp. CA-128772]|uniref:hypothetical protein n=1 Tax=Amycolatopsis sp. CA-128772 TaxID=2073159 RepID=UPI0011B01ABE|nr:hypothetical protein [Amycolatopsis sp. CA-128772]
MIASWIASVLITVAALIGEAVPAGAASGSHCAASQPGPGNDASTDDVGDGNYRGVAVSGVNAAGTVASRNFASRPDRSGVEIAYGETVNLGCCAQRGVAMPYRNALWYRSYNRFKSSYEGIDGHNMNTPGTAAMARLQDWARAVTFFLP